VNAKKRMKMAITNPADGVDNASPIPHRVSWCTRIGSRHVC
jgi:hypothetical protein